MKIWLLLKKLTDYHLLALEGAWLNLGGKYGGVKSYPRVGLGVWWKVTESTAWRIARYGNFYCVNTWSKGKSHERVWDILANNRRVVEFWVSWVPRPSDLDREHIRFVSSLGDLGNHSKAPSQWTVSPVQHLTKAWKLGWPGTIL